jgi:predicted phage-related endonuclease
LVFVTLPSYQYLQKDNLLVFVAWEEQQIPIDYLTVNIDSWEEQQIPIDYLIVNIDSWKEHLTHWYETFKDHLFVFVALSSYQYLQ